MGIGVSIFFLALGAILTFAVDWKVSGLDIHAVGWVLMAAGAVGLVLFFFFWNRRRVRVAVAPQPQIREPVVSREPLVREPQMYESRQYDDPGPPPRR